MFYSASAKGFFLPEVHGAAIPADAIEVTDEEHAALMAAQEQGATIEADSNGKPIAVSPPPPTPEQTRMAASMPKSDFCRALYRAEILTENSVVEAALGRWPAEFDAALAGLPADARVDAKLQWAGATSVNRMAPLFLNLLGFYAKAKGMTAAQEQGLGDTIFGIAP
jgi:hypothetical protein